MVTGGKRRWLTDTQWVYENAVYFKDPNSTLDYAIDWSRWLGTDTIATVAWTLQSGITQASASNDTTTATIWLSGGTAGEDYLVTARITTSAGRQLDTSMLIKVRQS